MFDEYPPAELVYLPRAEVVRACAEVDVCAVVESALAAHARNETTLPDEAYLAWRTPDGHAARSLGMPGAIRGPGGLRLGLKVINGSLGNPARGIARSQGLLMLFDQETAYPHTVMEAAYVSALRTAAVTAISAEHLAGRPVRTLAVIGCGTLARAHLLLLRQQLPELEAIRLYDVDAGRAAALAAAVAADGVTAVVAADARDCVRGAELVVPVTVVTEGYLEHDWFAPGALIAHVSLDDVLPEVVSRAGLVVVDDWDLVSHDDRRLLGRMYRAGSLLGPDGARREGAPVRPSARRVDTTLGDVVLGRHPGRAHVDDVVLCNPFGMSILDVALGSAVAEAAAEAGLGMRIPR